jgi:predicted nucleic acid-binding protein
MIILDTDALLPMQNAPLVSRNLLHFKQIPNLRVEDWTR